MSFSLNTPPKQPSHYFSDNDEFVPETPPVKKTLQHTDSVKLYLGKHIPQNTLRANSTALRALARFLTSIPGYRDKAFENYPGIRANLENDAEELVLWELHEAQKILFPGDCLEVLPNGYNEWNVDQLKNVRFYLIEFVVNYRTVKHNEAVKLSIELVLTMKGYILGIQRSFKFDWGYDLKLLEGPVFNCSTEGLMAVIDNRFSIQQSKGMFVESHNVLSEEDLKTLYSSESLSKGTARGFQARLVFDIALVTAMRPSALVSLTLFQFKKGRIRGEDVWKVQSTVGSRIGASKTKAGGWNSVREKPTEVTAWNRVSLSGLVNIFQDIDDYMEIRLGLECGSDRFFLGINHRARILKEYFKRQFLGRNYFGRIVSDFCMREGIQGSGVKNGVRTHGLRGIVITMLLEAGHGDSSVAMRTGHRDMRSLKNYQNLEGALGDMIFHDTVEALNNKLELPLLPRTDEGLRRLANDMKISRVHLNPLDGCIRALDGIFIRIEKPRKELNPALFYCRKGYYAIPVQALVDRLLSRKY